VGLLAHVARSPYCMRMLIEDADYYVLIIIFSRAVALMQHTTEQRLWQEKRQWESRVADWGVQVWEEAMGSA